MNRAHASTADAIAGYRARVDAALSLITAELSGADEVTVAARYALSGGGKRLRPILCLAAADACGADTGRADVFSRAAAAVELVHTYSLVHDDLPCMDDDDLRRGRATTHREFGTRAAMHAGFALVPLACSILDRSAGQLGLDASQRALAVADLCRGAGAAGMVAGQLLDLEAERRNVTLGELHRIHALKTGALFSAALRIGGRLARAEESASAALDAFGARLGIAFQITDDVLDVTRDAAALGKTPGKDSAAGKSTFVSLLGVAGAREAAAAEARSAANELARAGIDSPVLRSIAEFAVDRDR